MGPGAVWGGGVSLSKTFEPKEQSKYLVTMRCHVSANIYLVKVSNRNFRKRCEICSKLIKILFIVNFKHISHLFLVFIL